LFVAVLHECFFENRIVCFFDGLGADKISRKAAMGWSATSIPAET